VVATNVPIIDKTSKIYDKQDAYRTYVIGARIKKDAILTALYWDTGNQNSENLVAPYHYVRIQKMDNDKDDKNYDLLIVGGEDHPYINTFCSSFFAFQSYPADLLMYKRGPINLNNKRTLFSVLHYNIGLVLIMSLLVFAPISFSVVNNNKDALAIATTTVSMVFGSSQGADNQESYDPAQVTVNPGDSIIWENHDAALHTATSGDPDTATPDGKFDSGIVGANQESKPVTMPAEPGEYTYFCTLHPWMVGTVKVYTSIEDAGQTEEAIQPPTIATSEPSTTAMLTIPNGASVQGNPAYEPTPLTVKVGDTITIENKDIAPHTVTNGKDATDPTMGKLFDTSIINAGDSGEIVTADLNPGEYPYFCSVHPYMEGILTVQSTGSSDDSETSMDEETPAIATDGQPDNVDVISTNRSDLLIPILNDAAEYLKNGDNEGALVYMSFLRQQLLLQSSNSSIPKLAGLLVDDAIKDLQGEDYTSASLHLNLAREQVVNSSNTGNILPQTSIANKSVVRNQTTDGVTGLPDRTIPVDPLANTPRIGNLLANPNQSSQQQPGQQNQSQSDPLEQLKEIFGQ
jgi:plastocyanin